VTLRVLHVVAAGEIGGAERMLVSLMAGASDVEHAIVLFTPSEGLASLFRETGVRMFDRGLVTEGMVPILKRTFLPGDLAFALEGARSFSPHVIHAHTFGSQVLATRLAGALGIPLVRTEHSTRVYVDPSCTPFSLWSLKRARTAVAVSDYVRKRALTLAPWADGRMRVIRNGVDTAYFTERPWRSELQPLRLAVVGRLEPRKGIDRAIDAMALLPHATLAIIGDGQSRAVLEERARTRKVEDRVTFHGYQADVRPILEEAHALLSTSRDEGLGIALLEGMAMARPVIGFRVGGVGEIVEHGVTGFLTSDQTAEGLRASVEDAVMFSDLRLLGIRARRFVVEQASDAAMRDAYTKVYTDVTTR